MSVMQPPNEVKPLKVSDSEGPTGKLCNWIDSLSLDDVPKDIQTRTKYLILDGIACALIGARLPWSKTAADAVFAMEEPGKCSIIGWEKAIGPIPAALLNSTFIQGFELDDFHGDAPLHSNSIILPALFAAAQHSSHGSFAIYDGPAFLLASLVGYETGPRVGLGLHGSHMLSRGWHSGTVFGPPAAAASVSKLFRLTPNAIEDALGIACTQACGLMSAQYESMVKRMQHGFAARNGLFAALMAQGGYKGIERVFERPYGGYLAAFGQGSGKDPEYLVDEVAKGLGKKWELEGIRIKPYAALASTHSTIDCVRSLQEKYPKELGLENLGNIRKIKIETALPAFKHGGWKAERPLTVTGAQMNVAYIAALQLVDGQVLPTQFRQSQLNRDILWDLINKTFPEHNPEFDREGGIRRWHHKITIDFSDGTPSISNLNRFPKGVHPPLSNEEILEKWRAMTVGIIDDNRRIAIEKMVLDIDSLDDITKLIALLSCPTNNPIA